MKNDRVSIIIPIYNSEKYLKKCLDSVINQTYKNIEIILVNDGSCDKSINICNEYSVLDSRVKVLDNKNKGVSSTRNSGIQMANGKYVIFIDSDDYVSENHVESLYNSMIENKVELVISNANDIMEDGTIVGRKVEKSILMDQELCLKELLNSNRFSHVCWGNLYKKSLLDECFFNCDYKIAEDLDFLYNYIIKINKAYFLSERTYYWVIRESSVTHLPYSEKWEDEIRVCRTILDKTFCKKNDIYKSAIGKYILVSLNQAQRFDLEKNEIIKYRENIKNYINELLFYNGFSIKNKVKMIIFLCSYRIFKIIF